MISPRSLFKSGPTIMTFKKSRTVAVSRRMCALALVVLLMAACGSDSSNDIPDFALPDVPDFETLPQALVVGVFDGDTIEVRFESDGREARVRYIGIDAPETNDPTVGEQPYSLDSWIANQQLVEGKSVYLESGLSERDDSGQLLRYVWNENGVLVNASMVSLGLAEAVSIPPDVKYAESLQLLEAVARAERLGMWELP